MLHGIVLDFVRDIHEAGQDFLNAELRCYECAVSDDEGVFRKYASDYLKTGSPRVMYS